MTSREIGQVQGHSSSFEPAVRHGCLLGLFESPSLRNRARTAGHATSHDGEEQRHPLKVDVSVLDTAVMPINKALQFCSQYQRVKLSVVPQETLSMVVDDLDQLLATGE